MALLARGFSSSSWALGRMGLRGTSFTSGFLPHTHTGNDGGQVAALGRCRQLALHDAVLQGVEGDDGQPSAGVQPGNGPLQHPRQLAVSSSFTAMRMA